MPEWPKFELAAMVRRLDAFGVEFVVIGGIAAIAHGSPQITQDLDIEYSVDDENLERLGRALRDLDATIEPSLEASGQVVVETRHGRLDLQPSKGYDQLRAGSIEAVVGGTAVRVAGLDDLIAMKKAAGRPKDRIYVEELEAIRRLTR